MPKQKMKTITYEHAMDILFASVKQSEIEQVAFNEAIGRVTARDILSDTEMPPFNKSAMDGYACRREDLNNELSVIETIPAGYVPQKQVCKNECSKIMTGAVVPEGADCVVMVEYTKQCGEDTVIFTGEKTSTNICYKAEDVKIGDCVIPAGELIKPQHIAVMASVGAVNPYVYKKPCVGIIATGNELLEPDAGLVPGKIRNSNGHQLVSQVTAAGGVARYYGIAGDEVGALDKCIKQAEKDNDVIILSGGVSMGEFDLVPEVLSRNGFSLMFDRVLIKPGRPTTFFKNENTAVFALPGNPVSTFVLFEIMVKPFLQKMMGLYKSQRLLSHNVGATIKRKKADRKAFIPVLLGDDGFIYPVEYHGSAHINALCFAYGLIFFPIGIYELPASTAVDVHLL